jgi:phospholipid/cholesterol/gamma-HCH transport system ATP-binding protein
MNAAPATPPAADTVIDVQHIATRFGSHVVHSDISFQVQRAEVFALIGGSGSGKSTLLRELILLQKPDAGSLNVLGQDLLQIDVEQATTLRQRWGVVFQHGGLFASLTVQDNVALPLREHTTLSPTLINELAAWKLDMAGLPPEVARQYPPELSGGMLKRASLARALALDPELLFLDEPTAGLDPISAAGVDALVLSLRQLFGLTVVMVTHDLDTLWQVADRVAVLADGKVAGLGSMQALSQSEDASVKAYFSGPRAHAAEAASDAAAAAASKVAASKAAASKAAGAPSSKPR